MIFDSMNMEDLGEDPEEAFLLFESWLREILEKQKTEDRRLYTDGTGEYVGSFLPERYYVSSILAFLDEYRLDLDIRDVRRVGDVNFLPHFTNFFDDINYARIRLRIRKQRSGLSQTATPIMIESDFKVEIYANLDTIRKIVNQEVQNQNKKEAIFDKIASLQSEIDRDRTTLDALMGKTIELTKVLADSTENLELAAKRIVKIMIALGGGIKFLKHLGSEDQPKRLPLTEEKINNLHDDIPF